MDQELRNYLANSCKILQTRRPSPMLQSDFRSVNLSQSDGEVFQVSLLRKLSAGLRGGTGARPAAAAVRAPAAVRSAPDHARLRPLRVRPAVRSSRVALGWRPPCRAGGWDRGGVPRARAGARERHGGGIWSPRCGEVRGLPFHG